MSFIVIPFVALLASILTFFSGFGLGTILLPVFSIYYHSSIAIAMTAIVHFLNNLFKITLVFKNINWKVVVKFGIPSLISAVFGALILKNLMFDNYLILNYQLFSSNFKITLFNSVIGTLIIGFSLFEVIPKLSNYHFKNNQLFLGALISGFFGGLSGHQGALRSAFLIKLNLPKENFIATGTAIACIVDISRLAIYAFTLNVSLINAHLNIISLSVLSAFIGAFIGSKLLKKTTYASIKWMVTSFMIIIGLLMILGIIN